MLIGRLRSALRASLNRDRCWGRYTGVVGIVLAPFALLLCPLPAARWVFFFFFSYLRGKSIALVALFVLDTHGALHRQLHEYIKCSSFRTCFFF